MKSAGQMLISAVLGIVVMFGALGFLGACSNQDVDSPSSQPTQNALTPEAPNEEDWAWLNDAYQRAQAYSDLSLYTDETAELMKDSRNMALRTMSNEDSSKSDVRDRAAA